MKILMYLVLALGLGFGAGYVRHTVVADGSEPMPLCRPTPTHPCSKAIEVPAFALTKTAKVRDGGPIPLCPPRCIPNGGPGCGKCGSHVLDINYQDNPFAL